jgi:hypothetical protein
MDVFDLTQVVDMNLADAEGNVITDVNGSGEVDIVTPTTYVSSVDGVAIGVGGTTINGDLVQLLSIKMVVTFIHRFQMAQVLVK